MDFLITADVAYLLIVGAFLLLLVSTIVPGTGLPEIGFVACLVFATVLSIQLGINLWAVGVLVLSFLPLWGTVRYKSWRIPFLVMSILLLIGGSIFLFTGRNGFPLVNPFLAVIVSGASAVFIWLSADRATRVLYQPPTHNPDALIGQIGQARTHIHEEGSVQVGGELWSARSEHPIKVKSPVRVIRRDGLILTVEEKSE